MSLTQQYRDTIESLTDRPGGPDLEATIAAGRRRRRGRRLVLGGGLAVAAVVTTVGAGYVLRSPATTAVDPGAAGAGPAYRDFVPGTAIDEQLQATVAGQLPTLTPAAEVYPSDWNTDGPIADARFADATDWQAVYDVGSGQRLTVLMALRVPGADAPGCPAGDTGGRAGQPACTTVDVPGGVVVADSYLLQLSDGPTYTFVTTFVRDDGSSAEVLDRVPATSWRGAVAARAFGPDELRPLLTDPALRFPDPATTPPPPAG